MKEFIVWACVNVLKDVRRDDSMSTHKCMREEVEVVRACTHEVSTVPILGSPSSRENLYISRQLHNYVSSLCAARMEHPEPFSYYSLTHVKQVRCTPGPKGPAYGIRTSEREKYTEKEEKKKTKKLWPNMGRF